ncbi:hypothetical protein ACU686_03725 [Yinghuangia aomiensis]
MVFLRLVRIEASWYAQEPSGGQRARSRIGAHGVIRAPEPVVEERGDVVLDPQPPGVGEFVDDRAEGELDLVAVEGGGSPRQTASTADASAGLRRWSDRRGRRRPAEP